MRNGPLIASVAVLLGIAACKGSDAGMNDDLAKDLAAAKTSDALALAPHAGVQTVVSAQELSPQGRARMAPSSSKRSRPAARRTPHRAQIASQSSEVAAVSEPVPEPVAVTPSEPAAAEPTPTVVVATRPHPVDVSYPGNTPVSTRDGGSVMGGIIGVIGGVVLRGGAVDGDHCDPRARRGGGGGILINRRGPILRGTF
jgi:hypothetical protein